MHDYVIIVFRSTLSIAGANSFIDFQGGALKRPYESPIASSLGGNMSLSTVSASDHSGSKAETSLKHYKLSSALPPGQQTLFGGSADPHINDRVNIAIADLIHSTNPCHGSDSPWQPADTTETT
jgi:hypothetical protein